MNTFAVPWTQLGIRILKKISAKNKKSTGDSEKSSQLKQKAYKKKDTTIWCKAKSDGQESKKLRKNVFARGPIDTTKHLHQE